MHRARCLASMWRAQLQLGRGSAGAEPSIKLLAALALTALLNRLPRSPFRHPPPTPPAELSFIPRHPAAVADLLLRLPRRRHAQGRPGAGLLSYGGRPATGPRAKWELVLHHVSRHEMPPDDGGSIPTDPERDTISRFHRAGAVQARPGTPGPGPRDSLRRPEIAPEYNATIRDLVGVDFKTRGRFPAGRLGLWLRQHRRTCSRLPPVLMEKYLAAADRILDTAIVTEPIRSEVRRVPRQFSRRSVFKRRRRSRRRLGAPHQPRGG